MISKFRLSAPRRITLVQQSRKSHCFMDRSLPLLSVDYLSHVLRQAGGLSGSCRPEGRIVPPFG